MAGVCWLERARHYLMKTERRPGPAAAAAAAAALSPRSHHRVTHMLLIVSSVFVAFNLPAYTMRILAYAYDMSSSECSSRWAALQQLALMFFNTNFRINFILYCLSGQNFRRALVQTVPWPHLRARSAVVTRRMSSHPAWISSVSASFVSNCTEVTSNCSVMSEASAGLSVGRRRRRSPADPVLMRWTFDNSRQDRQDRQDRYLPVPQSIELQPLPAADAPPVNRAILSAIRPSQ